MMTPFQCLQGVGELRFVSCGNSAVWARAGLWHVSPGRSPFASPAGRRSRGWKPRFMIAIRNSAGQLGRDTDDDEVPDLSAPAVRP